MTIADSVGLGQGRQRGGQEEDRGQRQDRGGEPRHLRAPTGPVDGRGLGQAAGHAEPAEDPRADVADADGEQLLAGVDPGVLGGVQPGRAQALGQADERDRGPRHEDLAPVGQRRSPAATGWAGPGAPRRRPATPVAARSRTFEATSPTIRVTSAHGHLRRQLRPAEHQGQRDDPDDDGLRLDLVEAGDEVLDPLGRRRPGGTGMPRMLGSSPMIDQDRQARARSRSRWAWTGTRPPSPTCSTLASIRMQARRRWPSRRPGPRPAAWLAGLEPRDRASR